jgi:CubicO group peptidase (beta-lactamase class C family)
MTPVTVQGRWQSRFSAVVREFERNFTERGEVGAALSVIIDDEVVIDIYGGLRDRATEQPWSADTLVDIYSAGKPLVATSLLRLIDRGVVDLDDPIGRWWPEFAEHGKQLATVRHALCHRAGVPAIREDLTNDDLWNWDVMSCALARSEPYFVPGSRHMYHTNTYGHLIGEIVRRVSGRSPHEELADVATSIGVDLHVGLSPAEQQRCATVIFDIGASPAVAQRPNASASEDPLAEMIMRGYFNPPGYSSHGVVNTEQWRAAQVPSTNTHATASALAAWYCAILEPDRILSREILVEATRAQSSGFCPVLAEDTVFGLGFKPTSPRRPFGTNPGSFGHFGTGGAVGFADPEQRVAFAYVMNHVIPRWQSSRNRALIDSLYAILNTR